jgi:hypothetical protein
MLAFSNLPVMLAITGGHWPRWQSIAFIVVLSVAWVYGIYRFFTK